MQNTQCVNKGANINAVFSNIGSASFDSLPMVVPTEQDNDDIKFMATESKQYLYIPYDKKVLNKQKHENNHAKAFEILNTRKALKLDESKLKFKVKDRIESIVGTRDMEFYNDLAIYGYADFEDKMSENEWLASSLAKEYLDRI